MSNASPDTEKTTVNIRVTEGFLDDLDRTWEGEGFNSRSEYIRHVLRDAIKHPEFSRADLKALAASERDIQAGRTHSSDEIKAEFGLGSESGAEE